jgi:flagella basal body P-ring formation protein FlgA
VTRRFTGTMFVSVWADVPCAGHPHARGDVLRPEGITWMNKNIANIRGDIWDGQGGPWQATRSLAPGQPILATDLEPQSAIRRGDTVTLIFAKGNVRLSAQGEALSDGSLGETITVRNLQSRKQVFGVIRDSATIVVK